MQVCRDHVIGASAVLALDAGPSEPTSWNGAMSRLGGVLSPQQRLDLMCASVAAELSLSVVAVLRRQADGSLSRIAGAIAPAGRGQVHDHRGIDGMFVAPPNDTDPAQDVACWFFADRGHSDLLFFAGLRPLDGERRWTEWARRVATMVVRTPLYEVRPAAALPPGDGAAKSRAAAAAEGARIEVRTLDLRGIDDAADVDQICVRVSLAGLESLEPLSGGAWQRILDCCTARVVAIAGEDHVTLLGDGEYQVRLKGDASTTAQIMDAIRVALLTPLPGIGVVPALRVRLTRV